MDNIGLCRNCAKNMTHHFCTLFDRNYLYKGVALYRSLEKHCPDFKLWILCMDDLTSEVLRGMNLKQVELILLDDFLTDKLRDARKERSIAEFSWTCAANVCSHLLKSEEVDMITYLDADMYFYADPMVLFDEMGDKSIAIVRHNFSPERNYLEKTGKYNVAWVSFRNDAYGRRASSWWSEQVLNWCYDRYEDGKFGDQLYLDDWTERFDNVHVIAHTGADVAPWNMNNHTLSKKGEQIFFGDLPLIFYHFHGFHLLAKGGFLPAGNYFFREELIKLVYGPYYEELLRIKDLIEEKYPSFSYGFKKLSIKEIFLSKCFRSRWFERIFLYFARAKSDKKFASQ